MANRNTLGLQSVIDMGNELPMIDTELADLEEICSTFPMIPTDRMRDVVNQTLHKEDIANGQCTEEPEPPDTAR